MLLAAGITDGSGCQVMPMIGCRAVRLGALLQRDLLSVVVAQQETGVVCVQFMIVALVL
jgi:hypothetical protein